MFSADRNEIRRMYTDAWDKARRGEDLSALERRIAGVIAEHPEYHGILESGETGLEAEFPPEAGHTNPFLHMGLHIAVREQVAIDRPPGIAGIYAGLAAAHGEHKAEHAMLECLAETLWEAQREARQPDDAAYLGRLRRLAGRGDDLG